MRDIISLIESLNEQNEKKKEDKPEISNVEFKEVDPSIDISMDDGTSKGEVAISRDKENDIQDFRPGTVSREAPRIRGSLDQEHLNYLGQLMSNRELNAAEPDLNPEANVTNGYIEPIPTTPENLPAVISASLATTDADEVGKPVFDPKWTMVRNLPGYMSNAIRALGRSIFGEFTDTPIEDINVMASPMVNTQRDIDMMAHWIRRYGIRDVEAELTFDNIMPGYAADVQIWNAKGYTFMLVLDAMGNYIYSWPGGRGVHLDAPLEPRGYLREEEDMTRTKELEDALCAALEWIDAVPEDVVASLPAMPGFDRDHVDSLLGTKCKPNKPAAEPESLSEAQRFARLAGIGYVPKKERAPVTEAEKTAFDFATLAGIRR